MGGRGSSASRGRHSQPAVHELPPATTIDLGHFDKEARETLEPALQAIQSRGGKGAVTSPAPAWICSHVRAHLKASEGIDVE